MRRLPESTSSTVSFKIKDMQSVSSRQRYSPLERRERLTTGIGQPNVRKLDARTFDPREFEGLRGERIKWPILLVPRVLILKRLNLRFAFPCHRGF